MAEPISMIWVTRDENPDGPLSAALRTLRVPAICDPLVRTVPLSDGGDLAQTLAPDDWLVLTSPRAIELVSEVAVRRGPRVAVVGTTSARLAQQRGFRVEHVSASRSAAGVWRFLAQHHASRRICFMRSKRAPAPNDLLQQLEVVDLYDSEPRAADPRTAERATAVAFTSGEAVRACTMQFGDIPLPAVSIGSNTSAVIREYDGTVAAQAQEPCLEGVAQAAAAFLRTIDGDHAEATP